MRQTILLLLALVLLACQRGQQSTDNRQTRTFETERSNFFNNLLAPSTLARKLQEAALDFHPELMSDPKMFSHYASNEVKAAANMGVYLADLNYTIAYSQPALTREYFEASYELSSASGIEKKVLEFLKIRYEKNLEKNDSVAAVVDELLSKSTRDLQGTRKERLAGIAMAAYQIENLHLALGLYRMKSTAVQPDAQKQLLEMIMGQSQNVATIYNFLKTYSDPLDPERNPNYPYYANALLELKAVYDKVENAGNGVQSSDDITAELSDKVDAIRSMILKIG